MKELSKIIEEKEKVKRLTFLYLKASIHYNIAGKRFKQIKERFWNRFLECIEKGNLDQAELSINAFIAIRKKARR